MKDADAIKLLTGMDVDAAELQNPSDQDLLNISARWMTARANECADIARIATDLSRQLHQCAESSLRGERQGSAKVKGFGELLNLVSKVSMHVAASAAIKRTKP